VSSTEPWRVVQFVGPCVSVFVTRISTVPPTCDGYTTYQSSEESLGSDPVVVPVSSAALPMLVPGPPAALVGAVAINAVTVMPGFRSGTQVMTSTANVGTVATSRRTIRRLDCSSLAACIGCPPLPIAL
jgi:hypothetical protein